ncbi:MAG: anthrone oxygenase family protein [Pseudomonadota bacterium]
MYHWSLYFCLFLALWSMLVGGVFKAFSEFVMRALLGANPTSGIEAMQHINRAVLRTEFVAAIILIAVLAPLFAAYGFFSFTGWVRVLLTMTAAVYVSTVFAVTVVGNVPINNKLDRMTASSPEAGAYWPHYGQVWTRLNHLRTLGCIVTSGLYAISAITLISTNQV